LIQTVAAQFPALGAAAPPQRFVGVTVMPEFIQTEGVGGVLDNLVRRVGVTAVTTAPNVIALADEKTGSREPPIDAGAGKVRLLDRPLWGKRELFVRSAPAFVPDVRLYQGLRYQPPPATDLTRKQGRVIQDFIRGAHDRGLKVYFQLQAASPPSYRVQFGGPVEDDRPQLPDGRIPPRRVANNGSLASDDIRRYVHALIRDLFRAYPDLDGLRVDWPEYPPYFLDDLFLDFSAPAQRAAERLEIPFERMRKDALCLYKLLHGGLKPRHLAAWGEPDGGRNFLLSALINYPGFLDLLRFKALLVSELLSGFRQALTEAAGKAKELVPNAFPPPWNLVSGFDYQRAAPSSSGISVKLYTMHWPMMLRFYGDTLAQANFAISESLLVSALVRLLDIADDAGRPHLSDYRYPEPDEPHPVGLKAQSRKIRQAREEAGATPVFALAHGYGPAADFRRRLEVAWTASGGRVWINRYGYLSDEKLDVIKTVCR